MSTRRLPHVHALMLPETTNGGWCWVEPMPTLGVNNLWNGPIVRIDEDRLDANQLTVRTGCYFSFEVPPDFVSGAKLIVVWTATKIVGNAVFDFDYLPVGGSDLETLDAAAWVRSLSTTKAAPAAAWRRLEFELAMTDLDLAAGDTVLCFLGCDGTDAADTLAGARMIFDVHFEYQDV